MCMQGNDNAIILVGQYTNLVVYHYTVILIMNYGTEATQEIACYPPTYPFY